MIDKKSAEPSPESVARANRQRLAREEGARAMADAEKRAVEIRQNMHRLRVLREAKEASDKAQAAQNADAAPPPVKRGKKRIVR